MSHDVVGDWRLAAVIVAIVAVWVGTLAWRQWHGR